MTIFKIIKNNPSVLVWALVIHALAFVAIGVSFKSSDPKISATKQIKVIEAVAVDESKIKAEINKLKKAERRKKREQNRLQNNAKKAKRERRNEEKKLRTARKKQKELEQLNKKKRIQENKRLADFERKEKVSKDKLNKLEKERLEKQAQLEKEEKQRQEKTAQIKRAKQNKIREQQENAEIKKYKGLIDNKVSRNWVYLDSYGKGLVCVVQIRLLPSGDVLDARTIQSSGNPAFDRSAELAVRKASPLPVPGNTDLFQREFRIVNLNFNPAK
jgi:colicin import membrane protein